MSDYGKQRDNIMKPELFDVLGVVAALVVAVLLGLLVGVTLLVLS